jgi:hypothetical protein
VEPIVSKKKKKKKHRDDENGDEHESEGRSKVQDGVPSETSAP